jgi:hypothetical protein
VVFALLLRPAHTGIHGPCLVIHNLNKLVSFYLPIPRAMVLPVMDQVIHIRMQARTRAGFL